MTKKELTLAMLEQAGAKGVSNRQFNNAGIYRYSARLEELRKAGYAIETIRMGEGRFTYKLLPPQKSGPDSPGATADTAESQQITDSPEGAGALSGDPLFSLEAPIRKKEPGHIDPDQRAA